MRSSNNEETRWELKKDRVKTRNTLKTEGTGRPPARHSANAAPLVGRAPILGELHHNM